MSMPVRITDRMVALRRNSLQEKMRISVEVLDLIVEEVIDEFRFGTE